MGEPDDRSVWASSLNRSVTIDGSGTRVAWATNATNLEPGVAPSPEAWQFVVRDVATSTTRVVVGPSSTLRSHSGGAHPGHPYLSVDGRRLSVLSRTYAATLLNQNYTTAQNQRIALFDGDLVLGPGDRTDALVTSRVLGDFSNGGGHTAVEGDGDGYSVVFASNEGPTRRFLGHEFSLYLLSEGGVGNPLSRPWHGDPVDVSTGDFAHTETDLSPPNGPTAATLTRSYSSFGEAYGVFGGGWSSSFDTRLDLTDESMVTLELPGGRAVSYLESGSGWVTSTGYRSVLSEVAGGWRVTHPDGSRLDFDGDGRLATIADRDQPAVSLSWGSGANVVVEAANGYSLTLVDHDDDGYVDRAESSEGVVVEYGYEPLGWSAKRLVSASAPHRSGQAAGTYGVRSYESDGSRITRIVDQVDDTRERVVVENTYDAQGRVVGQVTDTGDVLTYSYGQRPGPNGLEPAENHTTVTNEASGDHVVYEFGAWGEVLGVTDVLGNTAGRSWVGDQPAGSSSRVGVVTDHAYDAAGRLVETTQVAGTATRPVASYTYVVPDGDPAARRDDRLASSTDAAGATTTYVYDEAESGSATLPWRVETPCDPESLAEGLSCPSSGTVSTTTTYGTGALDGLVTSSVDADGVRTDHEYWPDRAPRTVTTYPTPSDPQVTTFEYLTPDDAGWAETNPAAAHSHVVTAPDGAESVTVFDAGGRILEERDPLFDGVDHHATKYEYWLTGDLKAVTDPGGSTTTYDTRRPGDAGWDEAAEIAEVTVVTDPDGVASITKTDRSGDVVVEQSGDPAQPATLATTTHTYGPLGRLELTVDPAGVETRFGYDVDGRLTQTTASGAPLGDPAHTTATSYDAWGQVASVVGPESLDPDEEAVRAEEHRTYDGAGRLVTRIDGPVADPGSRLMTSMLYDDGGRQWTTIEHRSGSLDTNDPASSLAPGDDVSVTRYSLAGRIVEAIGAPVGDPIFDWVTAEVADLSVTSYTYDGAGRQVTVTDPGGGVTSTAYDDAGRVQSVTSPGGLTVSYGYDLAGQQVAVTTPSGLDGPGDPATVTAVTSYWPNGLVRTETDPHVPVTGVEDPSTRTFDYSAGGRLVSVVDALGNEVTYDYDERGNRTARTALDDSDDPQVQSWAYDLADRVTAATVPPPRFGAAPATTVYGYDPDAGWLSMITDPTGRVETFDHYSTGAVRSRTATGPGLDTVTEVFWEDGRGHRTKATSSTGGDTLEQSVVHDRSGRPVEVTAHTGDTMGYVWDLRGNLVEFTYPDGAVARYEHDPLGRIEDLAVAASDSDPFVPFASYEHDDDGRVVEMVSLASGGNTRAYGYDDAGRLASYHQAVRRHDAGWDVYDAELGWRLDGRLGAVTVNGDPTVTYDYDAAGQLTAAVDGVADQSWVYGSRGNRLQSSAGAVTTSYVTNPNGSVASAVTGDESTVYGYDDAGRRVTATTVETAVTVASQDTRWDAAGRLAGIDTTAGSYEQDLGFSYGADGLAAKVAVDDGSGPLSVDWLWDSTAVVADLVDWYVEGDLFVRSTYAGERVSLEPLGHLQWFAHDHHRSVINPGDNTSIADGPGSYDPFGLPDDQVPNIGIYGYRAELTLDGLIYLRNRTYDPATGQFLTQDPLDGVDGTPTVANGYHYTDNDPHNKIDPLGLRASDTNWALDDDELLSDLAAENCAGSSSVSLRPSGLPLTTCGQLLSHLGAPSPSDLLFSIVAEVSGANAILDCQVSGGALNCASAIGDVVLFASSGATSAAALPRASRAAQAIRVPETAIDVARAADRAVAAVGPGRGAVHGTRVHAAFRTQLLGLGRTNVHSEISYYQGEVVRYGYPGSVRLDAIVGSQSAPQLVYDLKTSAAGMSAARITQIRSHLPVGSRDIPILVLRPTA